MTAIDYVTKRARAQKQIMKIIEDKFSEHDIVDDPSSLYNEVEEKMLKEGLVNDENITFAKSYFSEAMMQQVRREKTLKEFDLHETEK